MLKKLFFAVIVCVVCLSAGVTAFSAYEQPTFVRFEMNNTTFTRNGVPVQTDVAPFIDVAYDRAMLPLRVIVEELGATVFWNEDIQTVVITRDSIVVSLDLNEPLPDGMGMARIVNGRTMVPVRYIAETFWYSLVWDENNNAVYISERSLEGIAPVM